MKAKRKYLLEFDQSPNWGMESGRLYCDGGVAF